jgi:hypothetical protein
MLARIGIKVNLIAQTLLPTGYSLRAIPSKKAGRPLLQGCSGRAEPN